ncbi:hypothetical protein QBC46DRAFT_275605, partial [Diplogelasinospora grovesii]
INRYYLLFKYILNKTGPIFSLAETVLIIITLRYLRYYYNSNLLHRELLLFKDE